MSAIFGETLIFGQQDGLDIELIVFGDEFYARYETLEGYTVVYDLDLGKYCYALVQQGRFASSGTPVNKIVPEGIRKHFKESLAVRNEKFDAKYKIIRPEVDLLSADSNVMRTFGPNSGLLSGRQVAMGDIKGLTILVEFQDVKTNVTKNDVEALLNKSNYSENGNFCSVNTYYQLMSAGKLNYTNKVVGPVTLSRKQSYYINNLLIREALEIAIEKFGVDLSEFDSRNEGIVDAISFMYAGRSQYSGNLWPHNHIKKMRFGNYSTHFYTIQSLGRSKVDLSIGTFTHESGHMLCRFPDLYDYGKRDGDFEKSSGMGSYCLMSSGNHLGYGKRPSAICAYLRDLAGWCNEEVLLNTPGIYDIQHGDYGKLYRFATDKPHEYFLIENRIQKNLDAKLPDSGLAIYHCDTRGSNELQDGTPDKHYQCALLQADGHKDLETSTSSGDDGDFFTNVNGTALSNLTNPSSREWDGTDSGLLVSDIKMKTESIQFRVDDKIVVEPENEVNKQVVADVLIPDNGKAITSSTEVLKTGILEFIKVGVRITHTYQGDLTATLESPSGKKVVLHSRQGGHLDNLDLNLSSDNFTELATLKEEEITGLWKLHVQDLAQLDVGRLDSWSLSIKYKNADSIIEAEVAPAIAIPDNNSNGIKSAITIAESGTVKGITVEVDITHTYNGDLTIELIAPSGVNALLKNNNGIRGKDVKEIYSESTTNSLQKMLNEDIAGDWVLKICDLAQFDDGVLNRWAIKLRK